MGNDTVVTLVISQSKINYLKAVLNNHKDFLYRLDVSEFVRDSLIKDVHIIKTIIESAKHE